MPTISLIAIVTSSTVIMAQYILSRVGGGDWVVVGWGKWVDGWLDSAIIKLISAQPN